MSQTRRRFATQIDAEISFVPRATRQKSGAQPGSRFPRFLSRSGLGRHWQKTGSTSPAWFLMMRNSTGFPAP
jgi:hypothetical protein